MFDETGILEKSDKVNRGDEEMLDRYGVKESNTEGQMVVDFTKWVEMVAVNTDLKKRQRQDNMRVEEAAHRWTTFLCRR